MVNRLIGNKNLIFIILVFALVMRLVGINQSLWLDEAIGAEAVRDFSYVGLLADFPRSDNHPPLYYLDLKTWTTLFGYSEIALRMHSVVYGVLTIFLVFLIAKKINKNRFFPYLSALFLATSQIHIYYSHEARMYAMAAFLASLAIYSFLFVIEDSKERFYWVLFSFSITALLFTDYMPVFLVPVFWIAGFLNKKDKGWWLKLLTTHIPLLTLGVIWLPTFLHQSQRGQWLLQTLPGWRAVAGGATFKQAALVWTKFVFGRISLINKSLYYSLVGIVSIPFVYSMYFAFKDRKEQTNIIRFWLIIPLATGFLASFWFPAFIYFRFLYVLPAFYILVVFGALKIKVKSIRNLVIFTILLANLVSWLIYITDERQQREKWRQATSFVEQKLGENEVVLFDYPEPITPYRWYSERPDVAYGATDSVSAAPDKTKDITKDLVEGKSGVYYFEYLRDLSDPGRVVEKTLQTKGYSVKEVYNFTGVGQVYYWAK